MVRCIICGKVIEENMEGVYVGKCVYCFSKELGKERLEVGERQNIIPPALCV